MKGLLISILLMIPGMVQAQYVNPNVSWKESARQITADEFELVLTGTIRKGFHLYSQHIGEGGPVPASISFEKSAAYKLAGRVKESGNKHEAIEPMFENMKLIWFEEKVLFTQRVKVVKSEAVVKGMVNFMTCNDQLCDPPSDHHFSVKLTKNILIPAPADSTNKSLLHERDSVSSGSSVPPTADTNKSEAASSKSDSNKNTLNVSIPPVVQPLVSLIDDDVRHQTNWQVFIAGFLTGLLALLFPCVWPVIPLTVSFFLKNNTDRRKGQMNAVIYGLSIVVIFVVLGVFVSLVTNGQKLNELSTGWFFNLLFFVLFFLFGLSFLGVFEITLPTGLINRSESLSEKSGLLGIFFMAFTLVLVSFSCTLPFIANLISVVTQDHEFIKPLIGFTAFGLALGLPFGLFAWFPAGLKKLPKSGAWMHFLKVTFGFIEIALSFIYLSKVDMAYHWTFLSRDIFLAVWVIIFGVLGLYLLGKIHLSPEDDLSHISVSRLLFGILCLAFSLYMLPGMWGSPLKPLSGFLPNYSEFNVYEPGTPPEKDTSHSAPKKYQSLFESPLGLDLYFDYDDAISRARADNKPLFIDFTGWGCVNCRKMEKTVWPDPRVLMRLKDEYITASLYVDDKTALPPAEQYFSKALNKKVVTLGDKNFDIQYSRYNIGAQPYYVLLDAGGNLLTAPRGYTSDISLYVHFLDQGLEEFNKRKLATLH
ncbi:MAG: cytochrome c biogenesis protein CcdA [Chitinophagales bacterium]